MSKVIAGNIEAIGWLKKTEKAVQKKTKKNKSPVDPRAKYMSKEAIRWEDDRLAGRLDD